jgi:hypothetical protein
MSELEKLDWKAIKKRINITKNNWGTNKDLDDKDVELIKEAISKDAIKKINPKEDIKTYFYKKRGCIYQSNKTTELIGSIIKQVEEKFRTELGTNCYTYHYNNAIDQALQDKFKSDVLKAYEPKDGDILILDKVLEEMGIKWYSIPYGYSRTASHNEDKEVVNYAYNKELGVGCIIMKLKTKYLGVKIEACRSRNYLVPIKLNQATEIIDQIKNIQIQNGINQKHLEGIQLQAKTDAQKEVEKQI